ncbi:MAG: CHAT domain-containing protein [Chloroflexota bacterium]
MEYLDFDLEVTAADGGAFTVRVLRSPAGEATGTMRLPFDDLVLQNRLQALQIALLRSGTTRRRIDTPEAHTVERFGEELWDALFSGDIRSRFEASRSEARRLDAGMRIKLRFEDASLAALPWEYLFDAARGDYVTLSASTPVVRYIPLPQVMAPLAVRPPLRVLGLIASPSDLDELDAVRERQRLDAALGKLVAAGLVEVVWMTGSTARDLQGMLRHGPWHIFHFVGHGGFDANRGEGLIVLTADDGSSSRVSATDLGRLLGDHDPLRLAVLNACDSARGDTVDVFASTAATLVRRGTPAVVAMQYEITDDAAIEFSRSFYEAIADGVPVDAALAEARKGVAMAIPGTLEWGTPVLYMRAPDGVLFDIPADARATAVAPAAIERSTVADVAPVAATVLPPATVPPPPEVAAPAPTVPAAVVAAPLPGALAPPSSNLPGPVPMGAAVPQVGTAAPSPRAAAGAVPGWSGPAGGAGPGAGAGARRANTKVIVGGVVVLVVVAAVLVSALGSSLGGLGDTTGSEDDLGPIDAFVTPAPNALVEPAVSTARRIVFSNDSAGTGDLYAADPTGSTTVRLTTDDGDDRYPAWSPDGSHIAFTRVVAGRGDLWVMAADGSDLRQITEGDANDWSPSWTPDGTALVFTSDRSETDDVSNDVWMVGLDGSEPQFLVGEHDHDDAMAAMAGDGGRVVFASDRNGDARSIYLFDRFRNTVTRVTFPGWIDREPTWSPDGVTLVFTRASDQNPGDGDLWSVRADDGATSQVTTDDADEGHPAFSPDGLGLAFQRVVDGSFHVIVGDTSGSHDLTAALGGNSVEPTWR